MVDVRSDWFTASRVRRLHAVIRQVPAQRPGLLPDELLGVLRQNIGGSRRELPQLIEVLTELRMLHVAASRYQLSQRGRQVASMSDGRAAQEIGQLLIARGYLHDQARQLIEASMPDSGGMYLSEVRILRHSAPQLLGLLRAWPDVVGPSLVTLPAELFDVVGAPWSLVPVPKPSDESRQVVGSRAEAYSVRFLRSNSDNPSAVLWVARDDDSLGYDIEYRADELVQRVEVKGSRGNEVRFFLSAHEYDVAHHDPQRYEIHFWGEIDVNRDPNSEYMALRQRGFPVQFQDLPAHFADLRLVATATKYRVTVPASL